MVYHTLFRINIYFIVMCCMSLAFAFVKDFGILWYGSLQDMEHGEDEEEEEEAAVWTYSIHHSTTSSGRNSSFDILDWKEEVCVTSHNIIWNCRGGGRGGPRYYVMWSDEFGRRRCFLFILLLRWRLPWGIFFDICNRHFWTAQWIFLDFLHHSLSITDYYYYHCCYYCHYSIWWWKVR